MRADLAHIGHRLETDHPETYSEDRGYEITAEPLKEELTRQARPTLVDPPRHRGPGPAHRLRQRRQPDRRAHAAP